MRKPYPSDLTDEQWAVIEPLLPVYKTGRPRVHPIREVVNAIFYLNRSDRAQGVSLCFWFLRAGVA